jgi:predicted dithiol-disulfide oxidoreductase (DUF899 family)
MKNPTFSSFGAKRRFEAQQRMSNKLSLPLTRFTVNRDSEGDCECCGFPLDSGDTAFLAECNEREAVLVFCSRACNRKDLESHRLSA